MKDKKRFIFDLDGTLLTSNYQLERVLFYDLFGEKSYLIIPKIGEFLDEYERLFPKYDINILSSYLKGKTGLPITPSIINDWISVMAEDTGTLEEGVIETLEALKSQGKSISVLTNWFLASQKPRLQKSGLMEYIDDIYAGDFILKPRKEAYLEATGDFSPDDCVVIGDNVEKDYIGPRACEIESILYDKNDNHHKSLVKVKKVNEIIDRY